TNQDLKLQQENQSFCDNQFAKYNPQTQVMQSQPSSPMFGNIAQSAQGIVAQGRQLGPTGSSDAGATNRDIGNVATGATKTTDLGNFLNNLDTNRESANERATSMFGNAQRIGKTRNYMGQALPMEQGLRRAQTQGDINSMWQNYYAGQDPVANTLGSAVGNFGGGLAGRALGKSIFNPNEDEEM